MDRGISALFIYGCNIHLFLKLGNRKFQEGSDAAYSMEIKGLAEEKKIKMSPSMSISSYSSRQV
jgi:hypothetical protein